MLMKVFSVTVPNPYIGEGSKNADRTAPAGETTLSYFTVFAKDFEDARLAFIEFCGRGSRVPTLTDIIEIGDDARVLNRVVVDNTPSIKSQAEIESLDANQAKAILRQFISDDSTDPLLAEAIRKVTELDEFVAFKGLASTLKAPEIEEVELSELQDIADDVSRELNQKLSFIERLTSKRGG